ncbi:hypothetical protein DFJ77DRAFT_126986 [Powellomyces hirtus]|nr:hypothetical protein DFJ77DRAFT_126986 [Powellomyces hirtus]
MSTFRHIPIEIDIKNAAGKPRSAYTSYHMPTFQQLERPDLEPLSRIWSRGIVDPSQVITWPLPPTPAVACATEHEYRFGKNGVYRPRHAGVTGRRKRVNFKEEVTMMETHSAEDYDRRVIEVSPITRADMTEMLIIRAEAHQVTEALRRHRHWAETGRLLKKAVHNFAESSPYALASHPERNLPIPKFETKVVPTPTLNNLPPALQPCL